jgi:dipeptidyl aminopeptidase/acylaminoacyl peptidase
MRSNVLAVLFVGSALVIGCGSSGEDPTVQTDWASSADAGQSMFSNPGGDAVAFVAPGTDTILEVNLDGSDLRPHVSSGEPLRVWADQELLLSRVCGQEPGFAERTFVIVSPDGATVGSAYSDWDAEWSPDGATVAVSCALDEAARIVIVGEAGPAGEPENWSRSGRGSLSDLVDIYLVGFDGSHLRNLTDPAITGLGGDWLPRWSADGRFVVFESNREGNSDIYVAEVGSAKVVQLTTHLADDQAPAWSRDNNYIVFSSNRSGSFEMYAIAQVGGDVFPVGHAGTPVPWLR